MDPLTALRSFTKSGRAPLPTEIDGQPHFSFDGISFPSSVQTAYTSQQGKGSKYTLDQLVFLMSKEWSGWGEYVVEAKKAGVKAIAYVDNKDIVAYLKGTSESSEFVSVIDSIGHFGGKREAPEEPSTSSSAFDRERKLRRRGDVLSGAKNLSNVLQIVEYVKTRAFEDAEKRQQALKQAELEQGIHKNRYAPDASTMAGLVPDEFSGLDERGTFSLTAAAKQREIDDARRRHEQAEAEATRNKIAAAAAAQAASSRGNVGNPIIFVPAATSAVINAYNAAKFLHEAAFEPVKSVEDVASGKVSMRFQREVPGAGSQKIWFDLCDDPKRLRDSDWNRVVAVVVQGKKWQFKDWPWGEPVNILARIPGIYVGFDDEKPDPNIKLWNVHNLSINKSQRHVDQNAVLKFWEVVDSFVLRKRPELYNVTM